VQGAAQGVGEFGEPLLGMGGVGAGGVGDAPAYTVVEQAHAELLQSPRGGADLSEDVDAVAVVGDRFMCRSASLDDSS
jgi:hypothetical protein